MHKIAGCLFATTLAFGTLASEPAHALQDPKSRATVTPRRTVPLDAVKKDPAPGSTITGCAKASKDMSPSGRAGNASCLIDTKNATLGGNLGAFKPSGDAALFQLGRDGASYFAQYEKGRIYVPDGTNNAFAVFGGVAHEYLAAGAAAGPLGLPTQDTRIYELADRNDGRWGVFAGGQVFWWPDTGAVTIYPPHEVYGDILRRYAELGGPKGRLGAPISGELPYGDNEGRLTKFENGTIYWWLDTGAFEQRPFTILFKGFRCLKESDSDGLSGADEPYFTFVTYAVSSGHGYSQSHRSKIFENVNTGHTEETSAIAFSGAADALLFGASIIEHDTGDPNEYKDEVGGAAAAVGGAIGTAAGGPLLGTAIGAAAKAIGDAVADAFDTGDDLVDHREYIYYPRDLLRMTRLPKRQLENITYSFQTERLGSNTEGRYVLYFDIVTEQ